MAIGASIRTLPVMLAVACTLVTSGGAFAPAAAQQAADALDDGDIVVTARKRSEDILKTPIAVTAITSADLKTRGLTSLNDISAVTPGLSISNNSNGRSDRSFQQISLRGFTPSTAGTTTTATFIDGVPVATSSAVNAVVDPERIEILKGPQSAFFGRNTFAGAVNVVNKLPSATLGGQIDAQIMTRAGYDVTAAIEGPLLGDLVGFRLTGRAYATDGSYKNLAANGATLGDQSTQSGSLMLVVKPSSNFTIKGFGLYTRDRDGPSAQGMLSAYEVRAGTATSPNGLNIPATTGNANFGTVIVPGVSNCSFSGLSAGLSANETRVNRPFICGQVPSLNAAYSPAQNTTADSYITNYLANPSGRIVSPSDSIDEYGLIRRFYHLHLNLDWEVPGSGITLSSLTGYNNEEYFELADLDNYDGRLLANPAYTPTNGQRAYFDFPYEVDRVQHDFSQEVRASYDKGGAFHGTIGASYLNAFSQNSGGGGTGALGSGAAGTLSIVSPATRAKTMGAFFGLTYKFTPRLTVSAEGRYQIDHPYAYSGPTGTTIISNFFVPVGYYAPNAVIVEKKFKNFLPRAIVQYDVTRDVMGYASFAKGVNPGNFNVLFLPRSQTVHAAVANAGIGVVVNPEKLTNYELGLKGKLFGGKMRFAVSAYYGDWTNQINLRVVSVLDVPSPPGTGTLGTVQGQVNSGHVKVKGIEVDTVITPVRGFNINLSGAITDTNIRAFSDPAVSRLTGMIGDDFKGHQMPNTSKYSASAGIQYGTPIAGVEDGSWFARGDIAYKSRIYSTAANTTWIGSRKPVNFRVGVTVAGSSVEAFVTNAFNDKNYTSIGEGSLLVPNFSLSAANSNVVLGLPELRTFGLAVRRKF